LLERNLVTIVGRAATPGRPLLYGTTREFLKYFGLNDLSDLPKPREIDELLAEAEYEVDKRLIAERERRVQQELEGTNGDRAEDDRSPATGST
jgi:segregation and condensation protein B